MVKDVRNRFIRVSFFEGSNRNGDRVTMFHAGWDRKLAVYWAGRLFGQEMKPSRKLFMSVTRFAKRYSRELMPADVAIIENHAFSSSRGLTSAGRPADWSLRLILPRWMELMIDVEVSLGKHYTKEILRRIRKYGLTHTFSGHIEDLDVFYYRMYRPLMAHRHRDTAELASYAYFHRKFMDNRLEMLFLNRNGERVAGLVIEKLEGIKRILAFGVVEARDEVLKWGVHAAAYYFTLLQCKNQGYDHIMCGSSMPVVSDGVTQFKLRLGAKPYLKDLPGRKKYSLVVPDLSERVMNLFTSNPVFHLSKDKLRVVAFTDGSGYGQPGELQRQLKLLRTGNTDKLECLVFNDPEGKITGWINDGKVDPVELYRP